MPRARVLVLAALASLVTTSAARAELAAGDACKLSAPVVVKLRSSVQGTVETELPAGTDITISDPGLQVTRILSGEVEALAPTSPLEAACAKVKERCVLDDAIKMATAPSAGGRQKVFRVKRGATLSVLERGPSRARVLVGGVLGRVNTAHLDEKCRRVAVPSARGAGDERAEDASEGELAIAPAPEGVRVAVLPFAIAPGASAVDARAFEDELAAALQQRRGDVVGPQGERPGAEARRMDAQAQLADAAALGARMGVPYVITGHLARDGATRVLSLSVYDVKKRRLVRTVRARPTYHQKDPWADVTSKYLNEVLPGAS